MDQLNNVDAEKRKIDLFHAVQKVFDDGLEIFTRSMTPKWDVRTELIKQLLTLSAGSIVVTVTVLSSLLTNRKDIVYPGLLAFAWVWFILTIIYAMLGLHRTIGAKSAANNFWNSHGLLHNEIEKVNDDRSNLLDVVNPILSNSVNTAIERENEAADLVRKALSLFTIGLITLAIFGVIQFTCAPGLPPTPTTPPHLQQGPL